MDFKPTEYIVSDGKGGVKGVPAEAIAEYAEEAASKIPVESEYIGPSANTSDGTSSLAVAINAGMTPDDIIEAYKVLAQNVQDNTAREAARIGNAQRSLGTLAARVASPSGQTSGLANYTYDRTMRPTVDSTSKALITQGLATGLQTNLSNALRAAKNRYEDARNRATANSGGGGGGGTTGGNNGNNTEEVTDPSYDMTFDFEAMVDSVRRDWGIYGRVAFKEDIQAKLYEEYQAGKFDASEYIRLWNFADNEYPSINDPAYNNGLNGQRDGSEPMMQVPGTDTYVDRDGNIVTPGSRVTA